MTYADAFYIRNKDKKRELFKRNKAQLHFNENKSGRDIILKARQLGFTTEIQLNFLDHTLYEEFTTSATIAHDRESAQKIFRIGKFAWDNLDEQIRQDFDVKFDNVRELFFDLNQSNYFVGLHARGATIHRLHISEAGFVKDFDELVASTFEAVPKEGTIVIESTANGFNHFYDLWREAKNGKNEFKPHFYNWTWDEDYISTPPEDDGWISEYQEMARAYNLISDVQNRLSLTREQFYWYFLKARRLKSVVKQEYPCTPEEAFLTENHSVFDLYKVSQLTTQSILDTLQGFKIYKNKIDGHSYILGVDTAEGVEGDATGMVVIDATDLEVVAVFHDNTIRPDQTAKNAIMIARHYNDAFIVPERNGSGLTTVLKLQEYGYNRVYRDRSVDKISNEVRDKLGWQTTKPSRDLMIDDFVEIFEAGEIGINDPEIIAQMMTFVRKDNGRREHDEGKHDDLLFALFLAVQGLKYHKGQTAFLEYYNSEYGKTESNSSSFLQALRNSNLQRV